MECFSSSIVVASLADSLGWHLWHLRVYRTSVNFLASSVSTEKLDAILTNLHLFVNWPFSLALFNILFLFGTFSVLITMCQVEFLSGPVCLVFCVLAP